MSKASRTARSQARATERASFLASVGQDAAKLSALPADASFRRYFRLTDSHPPMLLMDAPPPKEDVRPFVRIGRHLRNLGLSAPRIYEADETLGFLLIEDFGDATYTRLLDSDADPEPLFAAATDVLALLHSHPEGAAVQAPLFDTAKMLDEASELPDWYGRAIVGMPLSKDSRAGFLHAWQTVLAGLPPPETGLVLLDYHVDNLMRLEGRRGAASCGLLDFQDARIGPKPYDLLCLLRNERRGIDPALSERLYARYVASSPPADHRSFAAWYRVLAAQRYTKVVGRFARLTLRDGRDGYLRYLPRVLELLDGALADPLLADVRAVLDRVLPTWRLSPLDNPAQLRERVARTRG